MIRNKFFHFSQTLIILYLFPMILLAQADVSVEFSFKKPNEYVCEIQNMTEYEMSILFSKEQAEGHSDLYFDIEGDRNDTIRYVYYGLMKDVNTQKQMLFLNSGESYIISYKVRFPERFINARIHIKYGVRSPTFRMGAYHEVIDLKKVRNKAYIPQVLKEDEE